MHMQMHMKIVTYQGRRYKHAKIVASQYILNYVDVIEEIWVDCDDHFVLMYMRSKILMIRSKRRLCIKWMSTPVRRWTTT